VARHPSPHRSLHDRVPIAGLVRYFRLLAWLIPCSCLLSVQSLHPFLQVHFRLVLACCVLLFVVGLAPGHARTALRARLLGAWHTLFVNLPVSTGRTQAGIACADPGAVSLSCTLATSPSASLA
jgi:hypothetical protein